MRSGPLRARLDQFLLKWLRHGQSYSTGTFLFRGTQRLNNFQRVVDLITAGQFNLPEDRESVKQFLTWVNKWEPQNKQNLTKVLSFLQREYPDQGLWDIVVLPEPPQDGAAITNP